MHAQCPNCGQMHKVKENTTQATRQEPARFLGYSVVCPNAGYFPMTYPIQEQDIQPSLPEPITDDELQELEYEAERRAEAGAGII